MSELLEFVPNFSEGKDQSVVDAIVAQMTAVSGVTCLSAELDGSHNRAVVTLALAGGGTVDVPARAAARASPVLGRLVDRGGAQFRETRTGVFSLAAHPPAAVRGVAAWVAAADGPPKRAARLFLMLFSSCLGEDAILLA